MESLFLSNYLQKLHKVIIEDICNPYMSQIVRKRREKRKNQETSTIRTIENNKTKERSDNAKENSVGNEKNSTTRAIENYEAKKEAFSGRN